MFNHFQLPPITAIFPPVQNSIFIPSVGQQPVIVAQPVPFFNVAKNQIHHQNIKNKGNRTGVKVKFTPEEDKKLIDLVKSSKVQNWSEIALKLGGRNARQCRERWNNYLNPDLRTDPWTEEEDKLLMDKYRIHGTHWNKISKSFKNRSDNSIRNRWQLLVRHLEKRNNASNSAPAASQIQMADN